MSTTSIEPQVAEIQPYSIFRVEVARTRRLSPSFLRVTFTGEPLAHFADLGHDQRIKVVLPIPGADLDEFPEGPDWYLRWRELPDERRHPLRTYTVRAVRAERCEVDVDFVLHGDGGPASRWASHARPGDRVALVGPDARYQGPIAGREWAPPADARHLLLAGDETAVPAISVIAESLTGDVPATILLEVPHQEDRLELRTRPGVEVTWLSRDGAAHGERLIPAVREATAALARELSTAPAAELDDVDVDAGLLWEVPDPASVTSCDGLYAWLAGEASVVKTLRRHLVQEVGLDRRAVAFMGYWRLGRPEPTGA